MARPVGAELARKGTLRTWWISTELRRHRKAANLTVAEVTRRTGISRASLTRTESGETIPHARNLRDLLALYGVAGPQRALLLDLAAQPEAHGWWQAYADLPGDYGVYLGFEAQAQRILDYETSYIPGLLQTEAYAHAVVGERPERVAVRLRRQATLAGDDPLVLHAIVDEAAIRRHVGGPATMREQLRSLANLPDSVTLQVLPYAAGAHPGMAGPFVVIRFRDPRAPSAVFLESNAGQIFVDGDVDLGRYESMWGELLAKALGPQDSAALIADAAKKIK
jgi:transcriptional regulator with XRE-family HTH domain